MNLNGHSKQEIDHLSQNNQGQQGQHGQPKDKEGWEEEAGPIRVLLAGVGVSGGLLQLTRLIKEQPDMVLVGQVGDDRVELLMTMAAAAVDSKDGRGVDVLILGAARIEPPPGICSHLFNELPELKIMVIATSGDRKGAAMLYWQGLRSRQQGIIAATALPNHIRRAHDLA